MRVATFDPEKRGGEMVALGNLVKMIRRESGSTYIYARVHKTKRTPESSIRPDKIRPIKGPEASKEYWRQIMCKAK